MHYLLPDRFKDSITRSPNSSAKTTTDLGECLIKIAKCFRNCFLVSVSSWFVKSCRTPATVNANSLIQQKKPPEEFADFSRFNNEKTEELSLKQVTNTTTESSRSQGTAGTSDSSDEINRLLSDDEPDVKPTPAPRHNRKHPILMTACLSIPFFNSAILAGEEKAVLKELKEESSPERSTHRKVMLYDCYLPS